MSRFSWLFVMLIVLMFGADATCPRAQSAPPQGAIAADEIKAAALADLQVLEKRIVMIAQGIPAEKFTWNPGLMLSPLPPDPQADPYGRTVSNLLLHIAMVNFVRPAQLGAPPAAGFTQKNYETSTTDKSKVLNQVTQSFDYSRNAIQKLSDGDLQKRVLLNHREVSGDVFLFSWVSELNEYLGQVIAYGRVNGVIGTAESGFAPRPERGQKHVQ